MWRDCLNTHEGSCALAGSCYRRTGRDPGEKDSSVHRVSFHSHSSAFTGQTQQASRRTTRLNFFAALLQRGSSSPGRPIQTHTDPRQWQLWRWRRQRRDGWRWMGSCHWTLEFPDEEIGKIGFHRLNEDIWGGEIKVTPKFLEKKISAEFSGVGYQMFNSVPP